MKIYLRGINPELVKAWNAFFKDKEDVDVSEGDIFMMEEVQAGKIDAIVSPANSFGFMDGGIDFIYSSVLGWEMGDLLRQKLKIKHGGELLVGQAEAVRIHDINPEAIIEWLISAPTMRVPCDVSYTVNAYLAFKSVLKLAKEYEFTSILCPGLGTGIGNIPAHACAAQMHAAYDEYKRGSYPVYQNLGDAHYIHQMMIGSIEEVGENQDLL
jgi:O-acetyl-ADP-ribose deacetylase (regulator of RNase III)